MSRTLPKLDIPENGATFPQKARVPDPFQPETDIINAILATALFRCWHILIFFAGWSTLITILNHQGHALIIDSILVTVTGTVLGFVISYRTTSSFERYNEGRRLWSDIIVATRNFARTVWFHVPDHNPSTEGMGHLASEQTAENQARMLVEKKTVINLLGAYAVAVKHYLRGEVGPGYEDLYHSIKFLPPYAFPAGLPSPGTDYKPGEFPPSGAEGFSSGLPHPVTTPRTRTSQSTVHDSEPKRPAKRATNDTTFEDQSDPQTPDARWKLRRHGTQIGEKDLLPAQMPPKYSLFDFFPFSLLIGCLAERGQSVSGRKAARLQARMKSMVVTHNLPLELSLYLSSYVAALQKRKVCDDPTLNALLAALDRLVDSLTNLERVLTTPIPFSYAIHLWSVTTIYCLVLPFMIWKALGWLTIPASIIISFIYYGFLVAGEEIENPFGYDKNDLNLDHFTHNIIQEELRAVTSIPPPDPSIWAFTPENDSLFVSANNSRRMAPEEWVRNGPSAIWNALATREAWVDARHVGIRRRGTY